MIIENVIKTCSCFIDRTIWFVNLSPKQVVNPWHFDLNCDIRDIFIKDIQQTKIILDEKFIHKNTIIIIIIISCNDCFEFQLFIISLKENSMLDTLNCRFVTSDAFSYDKVTAVIYLLVIHSLIMKIISYLLNKGNYYLEMLMLS